MAHFETKWSSR